MSTFSAMKSFILFAIIFESVVSWTVSTNPLCGCFSVSVISTEVHETDSSMCYTYSIKSNPKNTLCHDQNSLSVILGICEEPHPFTHTSLDDAILSISTDHQYMAEPYPSSDEALIGLRFQTMISSNPWTNDEITLCLNTKDMNNDDGITSHSVQFMLANDDIITCSHDAKLYGLPCKSSNVSIITHSNNVIDKKEEIGKNNHEHMLLDKVVPKKAIDKELKATKKLKPGLSKKTREWIKFAFVIIMIVIILNGLCCTFITLRQSGALDKYFEELVDEEEDEQNGDEDNVNEDGLQNDVDERNLSYDVDEEFADDADADDDEESGMHRAHDNDISFSDLVKLRSKSQDFHDQSYKDDEKNMQKLRICISQMDDIKYNKLAALNSPFQE